MKLHYHVSKSNNFGDAMNPWFWSNVFPELQTVEKDEYLCGIGTIINSSLPTDRPLHILGSGYGYTGGVDYKLAENAIPHFVRGPLSAKALGLGSEKVITDPGVLVADFYSQSTEVKYPIGFIPHEGIHSDKLKEIIESEGLLYINPTLHYFEVFKLILSCKRIVTSAMHGAIISDSFRVPWTPVVTSKEILKFKWEDWCLTMGIKYSPISLPPVYPKLNMNLVGLARHSVKKISFVRSLRAVINSNVNILSDEKIFKERKAALYEKFTNFSETHLSK